MAETKSSLSREQLRARSLLKLQVGCSTWLVMACDAWTALSMSCLIIVIDIIAAAGFCQFICARSFLCVCVKDHESDKDIFYGGWRDVF